MAGRLELIDQVRLLLAKAGFAVSERYDVRPISFDVVARRDSRLLILKVLGHVDALNDRVAQELRTLAKFLHGTPLVVGDRSGGGPLEDGVVYSHRGIAVLTFGTLQEFVLENEPPLVQATPGGLNVALDGRRLRKLRDERALSLGLLAEVAGVSRRAIQMYEDGMRATVDAAMRLEEFLGESLITPIDPFDAVEAPERPPEPAKDHHEVWERKVFDLLRTMGYDVVPTQQSLFRAMARHAPETILTGMEASPDGATRRRAELLTSLTQITEKDGMIVVRSEVRATNLAGTPVVHQREIERARGSDEVSALLDERKKDRAG